MFLEKLPFETLIDFAPKMIKSKGNRDIQLSFKPIRNSEEKIVAIVVITTDVTDELQSQKEADREKQRSKMILKIVSGRTQFVSMLELTKSFMNTLRSPDSYDDHNSFYEEAFRLMHTLKGSFGLFNLMPVVKVLHEYETKIKDCGPTDGLRK